MTEDPNGFYAGALAVESYDLFVEANPLLRGDLDFYVETARQAGGPVLELGCGTGRVLAGFAKGGVPCVGLDLSRAMLDRAAARLTGGAARLVQASMDDFDLNERFGSVMITCRAFHHVVTPGGQRRALQAARRHLAPGGLLVLDLFDPILTLAGEPHPEPPPPREALDPRSGRRYRRTILVRRNDPERQIVSEELRVEALDEGGRPVAAEDVSWALRWLGRQEAAYLLELCGFAPLACYSDFARSAPAYGKEQLWVARAI